MLEAGARAVLGAAPAIGVLPGGMVPARCTIISSSAPTAITEYQLDGTASPFRLVDGHTLARISLSPGRTRIFRLRAR